MKKFLRIKHIVLLSSIFALTQIAQAKNTTQTRNFIFSYGAGVADISIDFDQSNYNMGHTNVTNVSSSSTATQATVSVTSDLSNSSMVATNFNALYSSTSQTLELNSKAKAPDKLDFWVQAKITINGKPVKNSRDQYGFSWAHDGKTGNWWIATDQYVGRDSQNDGLTVATFDGTNVINYCLRADKKSNYSVTVSEGSCEPHSYDFVFNYDGTSVTSVTYDKTYNPAPSSGSLNYDSIQVTNSSIQTIITVLAQPNSSYALANSFNTAYSAEHLLDLTGSANKAGPLDFWVEGDLFINNSRVIQLGSNNSGFSLAHEHSSSNWWIAANSGNASDNNLINLTTEDGKEYCLVGNNGSNYSATIITGECQVGLKTYGFILEADKAGGHGVYGIDYTLSAAPAGSNNYRSVQIRPRSDTEILITVTSLANNSSDLANAFAQKFDDKDFRLEATNGNNNHPAQKLDFWLSGQLKVSYFQDFGGFSTTEKMTFQLDLAQDGDSKHEWWIANNDQYTSKSQYGANWQLMPQNRYIGLRPQKANVVQVHDFE